MPQNPAPGLPEWSQRYKLLKFRKQNIDLDCLEQMVDEAREIRMTDFLKPNGDDYPEASDAARL